MKLYLVQHAVAVPEAEDPARPLSAKGREEVARTAQVLARMGLSVGAIRHSGKLRARQTAELIARSVKAAEGVVEAKGLAPNDPASSTAAELAKAPHDLMLVGHLPHLARLASLLVAGRESPPAVDMHMGGVVCLERDPQGSWRVVYAVPPDLLPASA
jgi:phosphohistidine phosphatase